MLPLDVVFSAQLSNGNNGFFLGELKASPNAAQPARD
jgi:hypothetical protein